MRLAPIARAFGIALLGLAAAAGVFAAGSALAGASGTGFGLTAVTAGFLGGAMLALTYNRFAGAGGVREAVAFLLLAWSLTPVLACLPFYAATPEAGFTRAYADAVSAMTTTGFTPYFVGRASGEAGLILWWNVLQWLGGGGALMAAVIVLAALDVGGPGVYRSAFLTLNPDRIFERFVVVGRAAISLYALAALAAATGFLLTGVGPLTAACAAMAAVSTGGLLLPGGSTTLAGLPALALLPAAAGVLFGAVNIALHFDVARARGSYWRDPDTRAVAGAAMVVAAVTAVVAVGMGQSAWRGAFEGLALIATAGWDAGAGATAALAPAAIFAAVFIGGSPLSTAGGVKAIRLVLLFRHVAAEMRRLAHPSSVAPVRHGEREIGAQASMGLFLHILAFAAAYGVIAIALAATGLDFMTAFAGGVAAVTNAGPVLSLAAPGGAPYTQWSEAALWISVPAMILGRVEILAALAALSPGFWRR